MNGSARYILLAVMLLMLPSSLFAGNTNQLDIVVFKLYLNEKHWGTINVLCDSTKYYINLPELLSQLEYKHSVDYEQKNFTGSLSEADSTKFTITGNSSGHCVWSDTEEFFVLSSEIETLYGFKFRFTLGSLALNIVTEKGVPIVLRRLREEKVARIAQQRAERTLTNVDTLSPKIFSVNSLGYSLLLNAGTTNDISFNGNVTGEAFRGTYLVNYEISKYNTPWSSKLRFDWQKPYLNKKWLKTLRVFHNINNMMISSDGYMTGVMISNEDQRNMITRGHTFQGRTTPDTDVEIYNNGQLIQYLKSDSLGNYQVDIASYEGENNIKAISYDSFGTSTIDELMVYMPPGLQAKKKFFYMASLGVNDYGEFFSDLSAEYGVFNNLTIGIMNQTLFKYRDIKSMVMLTTKYTIKNHIRLDINYIPRVKFSSTLTGRIGSYISGNLTYEYYNKNQKIINTNLIENFVASINGTIPMKGVSGNYYLGVQYYKFGLTTNYNTIMSFNMWWRNLSGTISLNTSSQEMKLENTVYEARVGYRFNNKIYNEFSVQYSSWSESFNARNRFNYQFSNKLNAYCELSYITAFRSYNVLLGVSWRLPWTQLRGGIQQSSTVTSVFANVSGSVLLYQGMNAAFTDKFVSGASLLIVPFLDVNGNGTKEHDEMVMPETKITMYTRADIQKTKRGIFLSNIIPNQGFKINIQRQAYEDIAWQIEPQDICLIFAPHQSRTIHIPIKILTELAGQISVSKQGQVAGVLDGIPITVTNLKTGDKNNLRSDDWGYYSLMVVCGEYSITLDAGSLERSGVICDNPTRYITIEPSREGQQLVDLSFVCIQKPETLK